MGSRGLKIKGSEGPGRITAALRGWPLVQILFLSLSERCDSCAGHSCPRPHSGYVLQAAPPTQVLASLCLGAGCFWFLPFQGSRAGHDLTQQPRQRWGCPVRPGPRLSSAFSPEAALNQTVGLEPDWFSRNDSLLAKTALGRPWDPGRWEPAAAHTPLEV